MGAGMRWEKKKKKNTRVLHDTRNRSRFERPPRVIETIAERGWGEGREKYITTL